MRAIQITEFGGPEVLVLRDVDEPVASEGLVVLDVLAAGVNYADTHQAENTYLAPAQLPLIPGGEVVGRTPDGRRVVALLAGGGYAERALAAELAMWELPAGQALRRGPGDRGRLLAGQAGAGARARRRRRGGRGQ